MMPVHMWWFNAGVAPTYREYDLALQFRSPGASEVVTLPVDVRKWLPGDAVYDGTIFVPEALKAGTYQLRVALLGPRTHLPAVRLAIRGEAADGWYDLGPVEVD